MQLYNTIILIGFMATGKTAAGRALAKKLRKKYVSTDTLVEKKARKKVRTIFRDKGEPYFRGLETAALKSLKGKKNLVISCGGGIVLKPENRQLLKKLGTVVWLKASPEAVNRRLGPLKQRPLLNIKQKHKRLAKIKEMLRDRGPAYKKSAGVSVDTSSLSLAQVVQKIASVI